MSVFRGIDVMDWDWNERRELRRGWLWRGIWNERSPRESAGLMFETVGCCVRWLVFG